MQLPEKLVVGALFLFTLYVAFYYEELRTLKFFSIMLISILGVVNVEKIFSFRGKNNKKKK